jgi:hypothetical protein
VILIDGDDDDDVFVDDVLSVAPGEKEGWSTA